MVYWVPFSWQLIFFRLRSLGFYRDNYYDGPLAIVATSHRVNRGIIDQNGQKLAEMLDLKVLSGHYGGKKHEKKLKASLAHRT